MKTVWKFQLPTEAEFSLLLPKGAKLLHVGQQLNAPVLWALVDTDADSEHRHFRLTGTGHEVEGDNLDYIGTTDIMDGRIVLHLFERRTQS